MRRMFSEKQIKKLIEEGSQEVVASVLEGDVEIGGDLSVTGDLSAEGDAEVTGDLSVTGSINGEENPSVKPLYWHTLYFQRGGVPGSQYYRLIGYLIVLNNDPTEIDVTAFMDLLKIQGFYGVVISGKLSLTSADDLSNMTQTLVGLKAKDEYSFDAIHRDPTTNVLTTTSMGLSEFTVQELGCNKIN